MEHFKIIPIGIYYIALVLEFLRSLTFFINKHIKVGGPNMGAAIETCNFIFSGSRQRPGNAAVKIGLTGKGKIGYHAIHPVAIRVKFIKAKVEMDDQVNHQRCAYPYRQADDIDKRKQFMPPEASERDLEIVLYHVVGYWLVLVRTGYKLYNPIVNF